MFPSGFSEKLWIFKKNKNNPSFPKLSLNYKSNTVHFIRLYGQTNIRQNRVNDYINMDGFKKLIDLFKCVLMLLISIETLSCENLFGIVFSFYHVYVVSICSIIFYEQGQMDAVVWTPVHLNAKKKKL